MGRSLLGDWGLWKLREDGATCGAHEARKRTERNAGEGAWGMRPPLSAWGRGRGLRRSRRTWGSRLASVRAGVRAGRQFGSGVIRGGGRAGARDSRSERCGGQRACVRAVAVAAGQSTVPS
jgi:hypothetical protein